jgi:hypothetical protein
MRNSEISGSKDGAIVLKLHMKRRVAGMTCSTAKTLLSQRGHLGADGRLPRFMVHAQVFNCCAAAASESRNTLIAAGALPELRGAVQSTAAPAPPLPFHPRLRSICCGSETDTRCYSLPMPQ